MTLRYARVLALAVSFSLLAIVYAAPAVGQSSLDLLEIKGVRIFGYVNALQMQFFRVGQVFRFDSMRSMSPSLLMSGTGGPIEGEWAFIDPDDLADGSPNLGISIRFWRSYDEVIPYLDKRVRWHVFNYTVYVTADSGSDGIPLCASTDCEAFSAAIRSHFILRLDSRNLVAAKINDQPAPVSLDRDYDWVLRVFIPVGAPALGSYRLPFRAVNLGEPFGSGLAFEGTIALLTEIP